MSEYLIEVHNQLGYTVTKRVPALSRGFEIHTNYGVIEINDQQETMRIQKCLDVLLRKRLIALEKEMKKEGIEFDSWLHDQI